MTLIALSRLPLRGRWTARALARELGVTVREAARILAELRAQGLVRVAGRRSGRLVYEPVPERLEERARAWSGKKTWA